MNDRRPVFRFVLTLDSVEEALSLCLGYARKDYNNSSQEMK